MTYEIIVSEVGTFGEPRTVSTSDNYAGALAEVITQANGRELEPVRNPSLLAALYRHRPLQAWALRENGKKIAWLAIQGGDE